MARAAPFFAPGWVYELKYDGFRALVAKRGSVCNLRYRSGRDASALFPAILAAAALLEADEVLLDGELIVPDSIGRADFEALRLRGLAARFRPGSPPAVLCGFDLLALEGRDLRGLPLVDRKALLRATVPTRHPRLLYVDHVDETRGEALLAGARALNLEGLVAKRARSHYRAGATGAWLKFKLEDTSDFIILGLSEPSPATFHQPGAILGRVTPRGLRPVGRVALPAVARAAVQVLIPSLRTDIPPLRRAGDARVWFRPGLVCEVRHLPTRGRGLRHPVFVRLRTDKPWQECCD